MLQILLFFVTPQTMLQILILFVRLFVCLFVGLIDGLFVCLIVYLTTPPTMCHELTHTHAEPHQQLKYNTTTFSIECVLYRMCSLDTQSPLL